MELTGALGICSDLATCRNASARMPSPVGSPPDDVWAAFDQSAPILPVMAHTGGGVVGHSDSSKLHAIGLELILENFHIKLKFKKREMLVRANKKGTFGSPPWFFES